MGETEMAETGFIEPDLDFIREIKANGGDSVKKCFQCATCSAVCNLTPGEKPFPRKEMILSQWGLKEKLIYSPDLWLCHQCGDCTASCPREANPSDVLAAVRNASLKDFAVPKFLGKWFSSTSYLLPLFAIPVAVLLLALASAGGITIPDGEIVYSKFMPVHIVDFVFIPVAIFVAVTSLLGIRKFWNGMKEHNAMPAGKLNVGGAIVGAIIDILTHRRFSECEVNKPRYYAHALTFFGFLALFATTNLVMALLYLFGIETPLPLNNPVKWLGNAGAIAAFAGVTLIISRRLIYENRTGKSTHYDWTFILALYFTIVTGVLSELARLADMPGVAYPVYFVHLVFVFFLLAYLPFSHFAHMLYRTTAIVFAKAIDRRKME